MPECERILSVGFRWWPSWTQGFHAPGHHPSHMRALTDTGFLRHPRERHCSWKSFGSFLVFFLRTLPTNITHFPTPHSFPTTWPSSRPLILCFPHPYSSTFSFRFQTLLKRGLWSVDGIWTRDERLRVVWPSSTSPIRCLRVLCTVCLGPGSSALLPFWLCSAHPYWQNVSR